MSKSLVDAVLDGLLDVIATATIMVLCSSEPTNYTQLTSTYALADVTTSGGDFTKANGDTNGRKVTIAAKNSVPVDTSGTAQHVGLGISGSSTFLGTTTCASQAVTSGNTCNIGSWKCEVADPS